MQEFVVTLWQKDLLGDQVLWTRSEQPFPSKNGASLSVSLSPIGFCQKTIFISSGQVWRGKNASPFRILKRSALSCDTSFLYRYLIVSRYSRSADITQYWSRRYSQWRWTAKRFRRSPFIFINFNVKQLSRFSAFFSLKHPFHHTFVMGRLWHI